MSSFVFEIYDDNCKECSSGFTYTTNQHIPLGDGYIVISDINTKNFHIIRYDKNNKKLSESDLSTNDCHMYNGYNIKIIYDGNDSSNVIWLWILLIVLIFLIGTWFVLCHYKKINPRYCLSRE